MRVLPMTLVVSALAFAGCDQGPRDPNLEASELTTSNLTATPNLGTSTGTTAQALTPAPVKHTTPARRSTSTRSTSRASSGSYTPYTPAPVREPVTIVRRHTKRDAAIGAGVGAAVGAIANGDNRVKGAIVGGVLGGAAGAIIGHKVDKNTEVIRY